MNNLDGLHKALSIIENTIENAPTWSNGDEKVNAIIFNIKQEIENEIEQYEKDKKDL